MESVNCILCGNNNSRILWSVKDRMGLTKETFNLVKCSKCDLIYMNPRPESDKMIEFYPDFYWQMNEVSTDPIRRILNSIDTASDNAISEEKWRRIKFINKTGKLLDFGCGNGHFLNLIKQRGWQPFGVEFSSKAVDYAKTRFGINVHLGTIQQANFPPDSFDVITLWDVLEHLPNPLEVLCELRNLLKADGVLIIQVPNINGWQARIFQKYWFHIDAPRHLYHFSQKTLMQILQKAGYKIIKAEHFSIKTDPPGIMISLINLLKECFKPKMDDKGHIVVDNFDTTNLKNRLKLFFIKVCFFIVHYFAIAFSILSSWFNRGGSLIVYAVKE